MVFTRNFGIAATLVVSVEALRRQSSHASHVAAQKEKLTQDTPIISQVCAVGDQVRCPYSETQCSGNVCCPGAAETGWKTYPCPSSREHLACEQQTMPVDCTITGLECGGANGKQIAAIHNKDCLGFCFQAPVNYVDACLDPRNSTGVTVPPGPQTITDPEITIGKSCLEACPGMIQGVAPDAWYKLNSTCAAYSPGAWELFGMTEAELLALTPQVLYEMGTEWRMQFPQCA